MKFNPFTSDTYTTIWSKYFNNSKPTYSFEFIENVNFIKHWFFPLYINVGKNLTKGINYAINNSGKDYKGKTILIYDIPEYFGLEEFKVDHNSSLKIKRLLQYKGLLINLSNFTSHEAYVNSKFNSKKRGEFRSVKRRLEQCFNVNYTFLNSKTTEYEFNDVFEHFHQLLSRRFSSKQTNFHHLSDNKWNFYKELVYKLLLEEKASMLVVYNEKTPIGIALNYLAEDTLFGAITVFDPDYYKFSVGKTMILKTLEWCFENNYKIFDFSKGDFDYKYEWANEEYNFHYHILYDSSSIKSIIIAKYLEVIFKTKFFLRKKNINVLYRRMLHFLKVKNENGFKKYSIEKLEDIILDDNFRHVDIANDKFSYLLQPLYMFLFANPEPSINIKVYQNITSEKVFIIKGSKKALKITYH